MKYETGRVGTILAIVAAAILAIGRPAPAQEPSEPSEPAVRACMADTLAKLGEDGARKNCQCQFALLKQRVSADDYDILMQVFEATAPDVPQPQQVSRMKAIFAGHGVDKTAWMDRMGPKTEDLERTCTK